MALRSTLARVRLPNTPAWRPRLRMRIGRRDYTSSPGGENAANARADRILSRLPPSMRKYTDRLRKAPVSHVVAFLVLHELTAIVPLFGLFGLFHYTDYVPIGYMLDNYGGYVRDGITRFEKYFKRKGWFGFGQDDSPAPAAQEGASERDAVLSRWKSHGKYKVVVEIALAYAITKALIPVRIVASVWATPWFASVLVRLRRLGRRK